MKRIVTIVFAILISGGVFSQWNIPSKYQPVLFKNSVVIGDTFAVDSGSPLKNYGQTLIVDTLTDGRAFFKSEPLRTAADTSYIKSVVSDTATQIRDELSDTATANRALIFWQETGETITPKSASTKVNIGTTSEVANTTVHINGHFNQNVDSVDVAVGGAIRVSRANTFNLYTSNPSDTTLGGLDGLVAGSYITFINAAADNILISTGGLGGSPVVKTIDGTESILLPERGMIRFYVYSETEIWQASTLIDNQ
jgi:hypothetical protein